MKQVEGVMKKTKRYMRDKPHVAVAVPTFVCVMSFVNEIFDALEGYGMAMDEIKEILASSNSLEAMLLITIMLVLRKKNK